MSSRDSKRNNKKIIAKIALYCGIGESIAVMLQVACLFTADEPSMTATNNSGCTTITQVQFEDGNVYFDNSGNTPEKYDNSQQNESEVFPWQYVAYSYDLIQQGNNELALEKLPHYINEGNLAPMCIAILNYNLAVAYYNSGQYGMAETTLKAAIDTAGFAEAYYFLGVIKSMSFENYAEAIPNFTKALEYEIKPKYLLARAWAYEKSDQLHFAIKDYYDVLQIEPQNEQAITRIEQLEKK